MTRTMPAGTRPWPALVALCVGFFMILADMTIVTVATPDLMADFGASEIQVLWVTSAYLLASAVPVLITGRLGDRFGPRRMYLAGLTVFTLASLWCGLSGALGELIAARVAQGLGAAMLTPQIMAVITRIFPPESRGKAMALWAATTGIASLIGPILGGTLVSVLSWEWIFFINVPVGVIAFVLSWRLVPVLATHEHAFDWMGVAISGIGMFGVVFGLQNAEVRDWDGLTWLLIAGGVAALGVFVLWEARNRHEPLVPLRIFVDRNFSVANFGIVCMGFAVTAIGFPMMIYAQFVRGYSAFEASLLIVPIALISLFMAPLVGRFTDSVHPRVMVGVGFGCASLSLFWVSVPMIVTSHVWELLLPLGLFGIGMSAVLGPLVATATRNLPTHLAGAGSGVYNATRLVGAVLGSAAIAALMNSRLAAHGLHSAGGEPGYGTLPAALKGPLSEAMSQSMLLPAAVLAVGCAASLLFVRPTARPVSPPAGVVSEGLSRGSVD